MTFDDKKKSAIWRVPLSDAEMAAWKRHPDTFFGVLVQRTTTAETQLDLYDFFHSSFKRCTKEQLLEAMKADRDIERLEEWTQEQLASIRAERLTLGALSERR